MSDSSRDSQSHSVSVRLAIAVPIAFVVWCESRRVKRTVTFAVERGSEAHIRVAACGTFFGISRGGWGWGVMRAR